MSQLKLEKFILLILITGIYILAWIIQEKLFLNWDISSLLDLTKKFLAGGTYQDDFFITSPPMISYFYIPSILISKVFSNHSILIFRLYILLFSSLSFYTCYYLLNHYIENKHYILRMVFLSVLLLSFIVLPFYEFGQRDVLAFIFAMPYFLLTACRLEEKIAINRYYAIGIGLLAGIGFSFKPQLMCSLILVELYYLYSRKKGWKGWARPEILAMIGLFISYIIAVFLFNADYVFIVVPFLLKNYYPSVSMPGYRLIMHPMIYICVLSLAIYILQYKELIYKKLGAILCYATIGFFGSYYLQHTLLYYHLVPLFACSILLLILVLGEFAQKYSYKFVIALGTVIFYFIIYVSYFYYHYGVYYKKEILIPLISFIKTVPAVHSIYFFSIADYSCPIIDYTQVAAPQKFDCLWPVNGLMKIIKKNGINALHQYLKENGNDKYFFLNMVADDLNNHKPDLIFVDLNNGYIINKRIEYFDYLSIFSENQKFKTAWKSYSYLTTVGGSYPKFHYGFQVYKRNTTALTHD